MRFTNRLLFGQYGLKFKRYMRNTEELVNLPKITKRRMKKTAKVEETDFVAMAIFFLFSLKSLCFTFECMCKCTHACGAIIFVVWDRKCITVTIAVITMCTETNALFISNRPHGRALCIIYLYF